MIEGRRSLIRGLLGGGFLASLVSFLYPVFRFMSPPSMPEATVNEVTGGKIGRASWRERV
jgi:hypothetical protein